MKLVDISHGPDWISWVGFAFFLVVSIVLISGHGAGFIAGYNTASKEEQAKYNTKKLCRVTGIGMAVIALLILVMSIWEAVLPAYTAYIALGIISVDCVAIIVLGNTYCKNK